MDLVVVVRAASAVAVACALSTRADAQVLSPGPLHDVHAQWEGDDNCGKCHSEGKRVSEALCLDCHSDLNARIRAGKGLHGATYRGKQCVSCHVDHLGRRSRLVRWPRKRKENFRHRDAGWPLRDSHRKVRCGTCHNVKNARGNRTYLGLRRACASCHDDPHDGRFGAGCESCHAETTWQSGAAGKFDHALARFELRGNHATTACKGCHGEPPRWRELEFADCSGCHEDPHRGRFRGRTCKSCHVDTGWKRTGAFRGRHPVVRLTNGHRRVACKACHDRGNTRAPSKGSRCVDCHAPVHTAKFGRNCKACHGSIEWLGLPDAVGRDSHAKTRYPLAGKHRQASCDGCHPKSLPAPQRFRGVAVDRCDGCHDDAHKGGFADRDGGECAACHSVRGFWPTTFGADAHGTTAFPLTGRHAATPCRGCHAGARPRVGFAVPNQRCADCHDNPHGEQFAAEMTRNGCATCHNTGGWTRPTVDHRTWPLTGAHASAECAACHAPAAGTEGAQPKYRGVPRACDGCHDDVHAGQFRLSKPIKGCEYCHDTRVFEIAAFDHADRAGYTVTGAHQPLECARCHPRQQLRTGTVAVRYRLGYRACKDCHANPHRKK